MPAGATLLLPHNTFGLDLGPGLSVKLGVTYVPDVVVALGLAGTTLNWSYWRERVIFASYRPGCQLLPSSVEISVRIEK